VTEDEWKAREYEQSRRRWRGCLTRTAAVVVVVVVVVVVLGAGGAA
jgi:hypothetical protein